MLQSEDHNSWPGLVFSVKVSIGGSHRDRSTNVCLLKNVNKINSEKEK